MIRDGHGHVIPNCPPGNNNRSNHVNGNNLEHSARDAWKKNRCIQNKVLEINKGILITQNESNSDDKWPLYRGIWRLYRRMSLRIFVTLIGRNADIIQPEHQGGCRHQIESHAELLIFIFISAQLISKPSHVIDTE